MLGSSAQQREMTHPARAKRSHHPIVRWGGGECYQGEERRCVPFVFIANCLNPCTFHGPVEQGEELDSEQARNRL